MRGHDAKIDRISELIRLCTDCAVGAITARRKNIDISMRIAHMARMAQIAHG